LPPTDLKIKRIKPSEKDLWLADEKGLRLLVKPNESRYWRIKYRFGGKQKTLAVGVYPEASLKEARLRRDEARQLLLKNIDPGEHKKERKRQFVINDQNVFPH